MPAAWFDTHAHVCDPKFDLDRDAVVEKTFNNGIRGFVEIADGPMEWEKAKTLSEKYPGRIWWAAGLHPYFADQYSKELIINLKNIIKHPYFVAIGEIGLDYAKCPIPPDQQKSAFLSTLDLALTEEKPLIIHCRDAYPDLLNLLRDRFRPAPALSPGVIHCFSGTLENAQELIEMGFFLGVDGPLTYPKADSLREIFKSVPLEKIVIETDSPYLPPQGYRGERNEPGHIRIIGEQLAKIRETHPHELASALWNNTQSLFRFKSL